MSFQLHLHGLSYELRVSADDGALHLDLEEHDGGQLWMGDFSAQYVEEITRKTGSFKKFALFVQMLEAAQRSSGSPGGRAANFWKSRPTCGSFLHVVVSDRIRPHMKRG